MGPIEQSGLMVSDMEVLKLHYSHTLRHWKERFLANEDKVLELFDDRFLRMWEFYLASSEYLFKWGHLVVYQFQLTKKLTATPNTRSYIY
jgi:cyclopropane-fatty-acyl-phospholipid synthase